MKNVYLKLAAEFLMLCGIIVFIILGMAALTPAAAQTRTTAWVETTAKSGKVTVKEIDVYIDSTIIYFDVSSTSHFTIGKRKSGEWAQIKQGEWGNVIDVYNVSGHIVFQASKNKRFYYKLK